MREVRMPGAGWTPRTVPYGADQTVYLVIDRFSGLGTVYREAEVERADLETIITDLMSGQFNDPTRVVAFNTLEHWSEDVSEYIALEIQTRCDIEGTAVPEHIRDFVTSSSCGSPEPYPRPKPQQVATSWWPKTKTRREGRVIASIKSGELMLTFKPQLVTAVCPKRNTGTR
jgi:hypothetical protein